MKAIILSLIFLLTTICIPIWYEELLSFTLRNIGLPWVITTISLRVLAIIFVFLSMIITLNQYFQSVKRKKLIALLIAIPVGFGISFIYPIYQTDYGNFSDEFTLQNVQTLESETGNFIIDKGAEHTLVCFFTSTCPHCMAASEKLGINQDAGQKIKIVSIFPGEIDDTEKFLSNHHGENFEVRYLQNDNLFIELSGGVFPSMFLVNSDGATIRHWTGDELNYTALDYLLSLEQ